MSFRYRPQKSLMPWPRPVSFLMDRFWALGPAGRWWLGAAAAAVCLGLWALVDNRPVTAFIYGGF